MTFTLTIFQIVSFVLAAFGVGLFIAWRIREGRVGDLEKLVYTSKEDYTNLEMDHGNLEAFANHQREENTRLTLQTLSLENENNRLNRQLAEKEHALADARSRIQRSTKRSDIKLERLKSKIAAKKENLDTAALYKEIELLNEELQLEKKANEVLEQQVFLHGKQTRQTIGRIAQKKSNQTLSFLLPAYTHDRLTNLKGLGAFIEQKMNALGIYSLIQIADLDDKSATVLNQVLELPKRKIQDASWIFQARKRLGLSKTIRPSEVLNQINSQREAKLQEIHYLQLINTLTALDIAKLSRVKVYSIHQISKWTKEDIRLITQQLSFLEGRIEHEYWVEQAQDLIKHHPLLNKQIPRYKIYEKTMLE